MIHLCSVASRTDLSQRFILFVSLCPLPFFRMPFAAWFKVIAIEFCKIEHFIFFSEWWNEFLCAKFHLTFILWMYFVFNSKFTQIRTNNYLLLVFITIYDQPWSMMEAICLFRFYHWATCTIKYVHYRLSFGHHFTTAPKFMALFSDLNLLVLQGLIRLMWPNNVAVYWNTKEGNCCKISK